MENLEKLFTQNNVPVYSNGEVGYTDCGDGCVMALATAATLDDFKAYCDLVAANGFEKLSARVIEGNDFRAFMGENVFVYAYYSAYNSSVRVVVGPKELYGYEDCGAYEEKYTAKLAMVGQTVYMNCGQGYIFLMPDGRMLVQDGGDRYKDKVDYLYEAMRGIAPDPENMVVAAWFISHPHGDHQFGYEEFVEKHGSEVKIEKLVINYPVAETCTYMRKDGTFEGCGQLVDDIHSKTAEFSPSTQLVKAHTGQIFNFGSVSVDILFTVEDYLPIQPFDYINTISLVIRINYAGQSILLLADTTHSSGRILENMFGKYLKADMVQLAHHGMWASYLSLYEKANAWVVLFPNGKQGIYNNGNPWYNDKVVVGALEMATDLYVSGTDVTVIDIPHKPTNNKNEVLEWLKA